MGNGAVRFLVFATSSSWGEEKKKNDRKKNPDKKERAIMSEVSKAKREKRDLEKFEVE